MEEPDENIRRISRISQKIDGQEARVRNHDINTLTSRLDEMQKQETDLRNHLSAEKARMFTMEQELKERHKQVEDSTKTIRNLQSDLEKFRESGGKWELREQDLRSDYDSRITLLNSKITGLEARLKRKQAEIDALTIAVRESSHVNEKLRTSFEAKQKELELTQNISVLNERSSNADDIDMKHVESLNREIGVLTATNENLLENIRKNECEKLEMAERLKFSEEDRATIQLQIRSLEDQLTDSEGSSNRIMDEVEKMKQQKAQIRCEYLQSKRENTMLQDKIDDLNKHLAESEDDKKKLSTFNEKFEIIGNDKHKLLIENSELKEQLSHIQEAHKIALSVFERRIQENEECENAKNQHFQTELEAATKKCGELRSMLLKADSQCETLLAKLKISEALNKSLKSENTSLREDLQELRNSYQSKCNLETELNSLKDKNKYHLDRATYLETELKETHSDHRQELETLSDQLKKTNDKRENASLNSRLRQYESKIHSLERQIEQLEKEQNGKSLELDKVLMRETELFNENSQLREKFAELLVKAEQYRDQATELSNSRENLALEFKKTTEEKMNLEDKVLELYNDLQQKEKLVAYFHSVIQPKQMQKIRPSTSQSTLISSSSDPVSTDIDMEYHQCKDLERQRDELRQNLETQKKVLWDKMNDGIPIKKEVSDIKFMPSCTSSPITGTMRHNIPHRWRTQFITITRTVCSFCLDGIPHFGHALKCRDCSAMAHLHCEQFIGNNCGLSSVCAQLCSQGAGMRGREMSTSMSDAKMNGWVKLWNVSSSSGVGKWRNSWALIESNKLSFFDTDNLATNNGTPFLSVNLDTEQWRIYNQTTNKPVVEGISEEHVSMLIEIKLPQLRLFMLAPTVQAKHRWVQTLQYATTRRISVQRKPSSFAVGNTLLLALDRPQNLSVTCTQIFDSEWLLLGTQEGLFVTTLKNPCQPFIVAGLSSIYLMELIVEYDMLLVLTGNQRQFGVIHIQQLRHTLNTDQHPSVQFTLVANISNCHLAVVSKRDDIPGERFVYIAAIDGISILQYVKKLGVFVVVKKLSTQEPCMCICSMPGGFIYGADIFHFVNYNPNNQDSVFSNSRSLNIDNCPIDFPISVLEITPAREYLLAFHNFGVFVGPNGQRTRTENVDWERVPLEFVYIAPYLFIVYCEFMEVVKVATWEGQDSRILTDDRTMFKCHAAHCTGFGAKKSDVLFTVSSEDRVELHVFNHGNGNISRNH